jgi:hypothetical protein
MNLTVSNRVSWLLSLGIAWLFILRYGYQFGSTDHEELLPPLFQLSNPQLYQNDFFMQHYLQGFNIRNYFVKLFDLLQVLLPVRDLFFIAWFLCIMLLSQVWYRIALLITNSIVCALLAPIAILFFTYGFTLGGNFITYNMLIAAVPAKVLASLGLLYFFQRRFLLASLVFGLGSLFQILSALQPYFVCLAIMLISWRAYSFKQMLFMLLGAAIPLMLVIIPMWQSGYFTGATPEQKQLANQILFTMRIPWHHLPSSFGVSQYVKFLLLLSTTCVVVYKMKLHHTLKHVNTILLFMLIQLSIALLYIILVEPLGVLGFAATQWFKSSMWVVAFCTILLLYAVISKLNIALQAKYIVILFGILVVCSAVWIAMPHLLYTQKMRNRVHYRINQPTELAQMHKWIQQNTSEQALFHIPPDDISFASEAQRSTWVSTHAFVHRTTSILDWHQRYAIAYGVSVHNLQTSHFRQQALKHFYSQSSPSIPCDYWLIDTTQMQVKPIFEQRIYQVGSWLLVKP